MAKKLVNYLVDEDLKYGIRMMAAQNGRSANSFVSTEMQKVVDAEMSKRRISPEDLQSYIQSCKKLDVIKKVVQKK